MSIYSNLKRTEAAVALSKFKDGDDLGKRLAAAAIKALTRGINSDEWKEYMAIFCDTKQELQHLTVEDPNESWDVKQSRAYIVSNAVCAGFTGTRTSERVMEANVMPAADLDVSNTDDPAAVRPFSIPQV